MPEKKKRIKERIALKKKPRAAPAAEKRIDAVSPERRPWPSKNRGGRSPSCFHHQMAVADGDEQKPVNEGVARVRDISEIFSFLF